MPEGKRGAEARQVVAEVGAPVSPASVFLRRYVDLAYGGNGKPGWVREGDADGDGDLDLVAGGGSALFVYENLGRADGWRRHGSLDPTSAIGANGAELWDVDSDGDLDVVCAKYNNDLGWWENPGTGANPVDGTPWAFHKLSDESRYLHDLLRADVDGDGKAEEFIANLNQGYWSARITLKWFRIGEDPTALWEGHIIESDRAEGTPHGHAGLDVADVDGDGHRDLAYSNGWYEAPDDPTGSWTWRQITDEYGISNALWRDMDDNGTLDLLTGSGHHGVGVYWFERPADPLTGVWTRHTVDADLHHPECLVTVDDPADGDHDVVACELFFGEDPGEPGWSDEVHGIFFFENLPGDDAWSRETVSDHSYPVHLLRKADVDLDGRWDLIGEAAGHSVISFYENASGRPRLELEVVDDAYPGNGKPGWSAAGDLDRDGLVDVVAGGGGAIHWYEAPGWTRHPIESPTTAGGNGGVVLDVDGDDWPDVVAARFNSDLVWWKNPGEGATTGTWTRYVIDDTVSAFHHDLAVGNLDADPALELVALYVGGGIRWYDRPADPTAGAWPRTTIAPIVADPDVGLALCDLDGDTDLDVVSSRFWFEHPADPTTANWTGRTLFAEAMQNLACGHLNGDTRLDVVGAQGFEHPDGELRWAESPADPRVDAWPEHLVAGGLDGPENLWVGDLDGDGLVDLVTGEMGTSDGFGDDGSTITVFHGREADGSRFERRDHGWGVGVSARLTPADIDGDNALDFTVDGNAEDHIYLWRRVGAVPLFADGFESGDLELWSSAVTH
jgi:hypothetical protein